jgi:hypothetical protein
VNWEFSILNISYLHKFVNIFDKIGKIWANLSNLSINLYLRILTIILICAMIQNRTLKKPAFFSASAKAMADRKTTAWQRRDEK